MSESPREIGPGESLRFREIVIAGLRAKQLLRGSQFALSQTHESTTNDAGERIPITASEHDAFTSFNAGEGP